MGKKVVVLLFLLALLFFFNGGVEGRRLYSKKHVLKTIKAGGGDIIDCVDIYKQPSLNHPSLKNHTIQIPNETYSTPPVAQDWHASGTCPQGTIPILRTPEQQAAHDEPFFVPLDCKCGPSKFIWSGAYSYNGPYHGAKAKIFAWNPYVEPEDYSAGQIIIYNQGSPHDPGTPPTGAKNIITTGWKVHPSFSGDTDTRLFSYWSTDNGKSTGCWNLRCPGFIQTNNGVALGARVTPLSVYGGDRYYITITVYLDQAEDKWYVLFGDQRLGYYPGSIFDNFNQVDAIQWGGVVNTRRPNNQVTKTQMGSGHFPNEGDNYSAEIRNAAAIHVDGSIVPPYDFSGQIVSSDNCYGYKVLGNTPNEVGVDFLYGGPGAGSPDCH